MSVDDQADQATGAKSLFEQHFLTDKDRVIFPSMPQPGIAIACPIRPLRPPQPAKTFLARLLIAVFGDWRRDRDKRFD